MTTISIRELHEKTGEWVRRAVSEGEIFVTDRGETIAKIVPEEKAPEIPYFARKKPSPIMQRLSREGKLSVGRDITELISEDREDRVM